ncbi:MAG: acetate kinase, partial [Rhodospirillaceae bacterium]|nr:acetate kinase [Rhodospirillaceae bacterium]
RLERFLYHECGLKGLSGISNDVRVLEASAEPLARLALDHFVYRIAKEMGALAAVLGGIDALIFTAGIGENAVDLRRRIAVAGAWLGLDLDDAANRAGSFDVTAPGARARTLIVPTDEERMIAQHTRAVLAG